MSDLSALADGMEKLAAAMVKNAAAKRTERKQTEPPRAPDREDDVEGSGLRAACGPGECDAMYDALRSKLAKLDNYELLLLDDRIMGVDPASKYNVKSRARSAFRDNLKIPESALYMHLFRSGGPRPHTIHVWKVPADEGEGALGGAQHVAAVAQASKKAPTMATRQARRLGPFSNSNSKLQKKWVRADDGDACHRRHGGWVHIQFQIQNSKQLGPTLGQRSSRESSLLTLDLNLPNIGR